MMLCDDQFWSALPLLSLYPGGDIRPFGRFNSPTMNNSNPIQFEMELTFALLGLIRCWINGIVGSATYASGTFHVTGAGFANLLAVLSISFAYITVW